MRFLTIPLVLLSIPILLKILSLVTDWIVMDLLNRYVGFFVLESVVIWVILLIWCISRKEFRMPKYMPMFYIIVTLLFFFSLLYTIEFEIPLHKSGEEKKETWWYEVYDKILKDSDAHGILGILMGLICIYIAFLGFQSGLNGVGVVDDLMKLLPIIALMTIFFSITIFGLQKEEFHRITRIIFNAGILLFIPLIYILGCFSRKYSLNGFLGVLFISFLISFCLGFACGYLIIPLTKTQSSSVPLPSLNYYTFSVLMSFLVGITLYQLSEPDSGLSKSVKKFLSIENHNN